MASWLWYQLPCFPQREFFTSYCFPRKNVYWNFYFALKMLVKQEMQRQTFTLVVKRQVKLPTSSSQCASQCNASVPCGHRFKCRMLSSHAASCSSKQYKLAQRMWPLSPYGRPRWNSRPGTGPSTPTGSKSRMGAKQRKKGLSLQLYL